MSNEVMSDEQTLHSEGSSTRFTHHHHSYLITQYLSLFPAAGVSFSFNRIAAAHHFNFIFLAGFQLTQGVGVIVDIAHLATGKLYDLVTGFQAGF